MRTCKMICIATLIVSFLAVAGGVGEDTEIRHFSPQNALDGTLETEIDFINTIKTKSDANLDLITKDLDDSAILPQKIRYDFDRIILDQNNYFDKSYDWFFGSEIQYLMDYTSLNLDQIAFSGEEL